MKNKKDYTNSNNNNYNNNTSEAEDDRLYTRPFTPSIIDLYEDDGSYNSENANKLDWDVDKDDSSSYEYNQSEDTKYDKKNNASSIYLQDNNGKSYDEVIPFDFSEDEKEEQDEDPSIEELFASEAYKKLQDRAISLDEIESKEKLAYALSGNRPYKIIDYIKGVYVVGSDKLAGIHNSILIKCINEMDYDQLDCFFSHSVNILEILNASISVGIDDLFKMNQVNRDICIQHSKSLIKLISVEPTASLDKLNNLDQKRLEIVLKYFSTHTRNFFINFDSFVRLLEDNTRYVSINEIFSSAKIRYNDPIIKHPIATFNEAALNSISKRKNRQEQLIKLYIDNKYSLTLCDFLFTQMPGFISTIKLKPSSNYPNIGVDYIIDLYTNKPKFCAIILYHRDVVKLFIEEGIVSLDDMERIYDKSSEALIGLLANREVVKDFYRNREDFYNSIELEKGDEALTYIKNNKPDLFVTLIRFNTQITELITSGAMLLNEIYDTYDISIKTLNNLLGKHTEVLKFKEDSERFWDAIHVSPQEIQDILLQYDNKKRISLFIMLIRFKDEVEYLVSNGVVTFNQIVAIWNLNDCALQLILQNFEKLEYLISRDILTFENILNVLKHGVGINALEITLQNFLKIELLLCDSEKLNSIQDNDSRLEYWLNGKERLMTFEEMLEILSKNPDGFKIMLKHFEKVDYLIYNNCVDFDQILQIMENDASIFEFVLKNFLKVEYLLSNNLITFEEILSFAATRQLMLQGILENCQNLDLLNIGHKNQTTCPAISFQGDSDIKSKNLSSVSYIATQETKIDSLPTEEEKTADISKAISNAISQDEPKSWAKRIKAEEVIDKNTCLSCGFS